MSRCSKGGVHMSMISFTNKTCKTSDLITRTLIDNFEEHFAMYSLTTIKKIPSIEIHNDNELYYTIKCNVKEKDELVKFLLSFRCSHFEKTLIPIFTEIDNGLKIEFKIDGE